MPESSEIVINTGPILALIAGMGDLSFLSILYERVVVPREVSDELLVENGIRFGAQEFRSCEALEKLNYYADAIPYVQNSLDKGEAAVIETAFKEEIATVCIDEPVGRRVARLCGLNVTGSIGTVIRAKESGHIDSVKEVIKSMEAGGIYLSDRVVKKALSEAGES